MSPPSAILHATRDIVVASLLSLGLCFSHEARANEAESVRLTDAVLFTDAEADLLLNAQVKVTLSAVLIDAVKRGVPLYFVTEFEVSKRRWYWFDERLIQQTKNIRIGYHPVTQQFRVAIGGLHQVSYPTLDEALAGALVLRGWQVASLSELQSAGLDQPLFKNSKAFEARVRVRLDSGLLPKPLQVNALTNRDWNLSSDWVSIRLPPQPHGSESGSGLVPSGTRDPAPAKDAT